MPDRTSCQIHIPHKTLSPELLAVEGIDFHQLKLGLIQRDAALRDNWSTIERFLNEIAPNCFGGGGEGCGTPGPATGDPNVATGENACAEGDGTSAGGDQSVTMGKHNTIDAGGTDNSVIAGGLDNHIIEGLDSIILAGARNVIDNAGAGSAVGGEDCRVEDSDVFAYGSNLFVANGGHASAVFGESNQVTNESTEASFVEGIGAVAWFSPQHAFANSSVRDDVPGGYTRSVGQGSRVSWYFQTSSDTPTTLYGVTLPDIPYLYTFTGVVQARNDIADVASSWTFQAVVSSDGSGGWRFVGTPTATVIAADVAASPWSAMPVLNSDVFDIAIVGDGADIVDWTGVLDLCETLGGVSL